MLTLSAISMNFGGLQVLEDVGLTVPERGIFGLIGPNGAGKTTVFNLISGILAPNTGTIEFSGQRIDGRRPHLITRLGIARTFQNIRIFREMTLIENVEVALGGRSDRGAIAALLPWTGRRDAKRRDKETVHELLAQVGLADKSERFAGALSYGEQRRLEIARALATEPRLLLLDEPTAGMNSFEKRQLLEEVLKLNARGLSVLIVEHDMSVIMGLCHEITVLNFGRVIGRGTPEEIRNNPAVIEAYLGRDEESPSQEESIPS